MGFGGSPWGGGPWGGFGGGGPVVVNETVPLSENLTVSLPLVAVAATASTAFAVEIAFSHDLDPFFAANFDPANYPISPTLTVLSVVPGTFPNRVRLNTTEQGPVNYQITVVTGRSVFSDLLTPPNQLLLFAGFPVTPRFVAAAQGDRKVMLVFSTAMAQTSAFTDPTNYEIRDFNGNTITVVSATPQGNAPISRVTLVLDSDLEKGGYYVAEVNPAVQTSVGLSLSPPIDVFRWNALEAPITTGPIVIPIEDFSGEVTTGLLGQPDGQVFFSPALDVSAPNSVIQVEDIALCTKAFDSYEFPNPPDPIPLFTFGGAVQTTLGQAGVVLWAPAERLGQARVEVRDTRVDTLPLFADAVTEMLLVEPIDITRGGFLNDERWRLFGGDPTTFTTYDNSTPSGPGPAEYTIFPTDVVQTTDVAQTVSAWVRPLADSVAVTDAVGVVITKSLSDTISAVDSGDAYVTGGFTEEFSPEFE